MLRQWCVLLAICAVFGSPLSTLAQESRRSRPKPKADEPARTQEPVGTTAPTAGPAALGPPPEVETEVEPPAPILIEGPSDPATASPDPAPPPQDPAAPPPPPATTGDYAGTGSYVEDDDPLDGDTADEPDAMYAEEETREFSVRIDPLNWLLLGRLGFELELGVWKFISVELIPVFVTAGEPLLLNYSRLDNDLKQESRGIGPIAGASLGVGFWQFGEPFSGYVARLNFTNYAYTYSAADGDGVFDRVEFTERRIALFLGSHSRFGPFTLAGGFGLGIELNQAERCGLQRSRSGSGTFRVTGRSTDCEGRQQIALDRDLSQVADLNGPLHPVYFEARFSLGLVF